MAKRKELIRELKLKGSVELGRMLKENEPIEVGPAVEYFDGGIIVNERFETGVEGLYAAGECTLGPFGANRVCSAITEMLVHGADAGENAGDYAKKVKAPAIRECIAHLECTVDSQVTTGDHTVFVGKVVAAYANPGVFTESYDLNNARMLYHAGGNNFAILDPKTYKP